MVISEKVVGVERIHTDGEVVRGERLPALIAGKSPDGAAQQLRGVFLGVTCQLPAGFVNIPAILCSPSAFY